MSLAEVLAPLYPLFLAVSFVFGTVAGSFGNVCISRWPAGESVVRPRSRCPKCRTPIAWYDNIPLISWLILGARCRHCSLPIGWQYPLVEALTGVLFLLVFWRFGFTAATPVYMAFAASMIIITFQDLADWTIPNEITLPGIPVALGLAVLGLLYPGSMLRITDPLAALDGIALGAFLICLLDRVTVLLLKKPGMGFGDVKLLALLGGFLGWRGVLGTLMFASFLGSIVGITMILYFRFYGAATQDESGDEKSEEDAPPPPLDLLADVILVGAYLYLGARMLLYMAYNPSDLPIDLDTPARIGALFFGLVVLAVTVLPRLIKSASPESIKPPVRESSGEEEEEEIALQGHYIPFGPYLAVAGLLYLFIGPELIQAYFAVLQPEPLAPFMAP